jgi:hypothetical protein
VRRRLPYLLVAVGLGLAGASGFLASSAIGQTDEPVRTVTVNVPTGAQGPAGPPGPPGPPGVAACPAGYTAADLRINHPGGQVTVRTCLKEG